VIDYAPKLFDMPQETKDRLAMVNNESFFGYNRLGAEITKGATDYREQVSLVCIDLTTKLWTDPPPSLTSRPRGEDSANPGPPTMNDSGATRRWVVCFGSLTLIQL
jgi:isopenicillin N synthase-like dioxygenase